ncbi:MAG TPA: flagellar export chaperone FliS [Tissierellaceae bacterium]
MNHAYAKDTYKNNQILTAPQNKLVVMLYDGAIRNLKLSKIEMENKDLNKVNEYLQKTQDIVFELMSTLNLEVGGDVAKNLYSLYDYMYSRLIEANIKKDLEIINEIQGLLEELRDAWAQI